MGTYCCFNPGLGFRSVATRRQARPRPRRTCFNPGLGFRSVATSPTVFGRREAARVSIPVWVFGPSRPTDGMALTEDDLCFNPGLGFRSVATLRKAQRQNPEFLFQSRSGFSVRRDSSSTLSASYRITCFNPGLGFRSVATVRPSARLRARARFQSRSGFSVRRDPFLLIPSLVDRRVSIPVWVFGPSRPGRGRGG